MATPVVPPTLSFGDQSLLGGLTIGPNSRLLKSAYDMKRNHLVAQEQKTFVQMGTRLTAADNSGVKEMMCIRPLRAGKTGARLGDTIVASVKEVCAPGELKKGANDKKDVVHKGDVVRAIVVRTSKQQRRSDGTHITFDDNAAVILSKERKGELMGSRVFGPVPQELREKNHTKILSLAEALV